MTSECAELLQQATCYDKALLVPSGTSAIEIMSQFLSMRGIKKIIAPSYTFSTSVLPFIERGIELVLCDNDINTGCITREQLEKVYTNDVGAILSVSYGGAIPDQPNIAQYCREKSLIYLEDNAQSIGNIGRDKGILPVCNAVWCQLSLYEKYHMWRRWCPSVFQETLEDEILPIVNKGTDRHLFDKKIVKKYNVSSFGSSHIMSEWNAAFLREQLINEKNITIERQDQWVYYALGLKEKYKFLYQDMYSQLSKCPTNGHIFAIILESPEQQDFLAAKLSQNSIQATSHYHPLHKNKFIQKFISPANCPNATRYQNVSYAFHLDSNWTQIGLNKIISALTKI